MTAGSEWGSPVFDALLVAAVVRRIPHAVLLEGPRGIGKASAALLLARALLCGDLGATGACPAQVETGSHADLHWLRPPPDGVDIPVEAVRDLQRTLERLPAAGGARVAIVAPAERLNDQGQNALLKTLEEPGVDTFLIVVTARPEGLLETVRSRLSRVRLAPWPIDRLRTVLAAEAGALPEHVEFAIRASRGAVGTARALLAAPARKLDTTIATFLADPRLGTSMIAAEILDGAVGREAVDQRVELALVCLRARLREGLDSAVAVDSTGDYDPAPAGAWLSALEAALAVEEDVTLGIPAQQALDAAFLRIAGHLGADPATA